jgi:hypothetical protein
MSKPTFKDENITYLHNHWEERRGVQEGGIFWIHSPILIQN